MAGKEASPGTAILVVSLSIRRSKDATGRALNQGPASFPAQLGDGPVCQDLGLFRRGSCKWHQSLVHPMPLMVCARGRRGRLLRCLAPTSEPQLDVRVWALQALGEDHLDQSMRPKRKAELHS